MKLRRMTRFSIKQVSLPSCLLLSLGCVTLLRLPLESPQENWDHNKLVAATEGPINNCEPRYSSFRCITNSFYGPASVYGFPIHNVSCLYHNLTYDGASNTFIYHARRTETNALNLPPVSLAPRGFDLPIMKWKARKVFNKMVKYYEYRPRIVYETIPCSFETDKRLYAYYSPIVAPWNFAHTLLCDLFGLFWAMVELDVVVTDAAVVAVGSHYSSSFQLPNRNAAFALFSRTKPQYDSSLPEKTVFHSVVAGSGTKSWSWVTSEYKASGSAQLWWRFRRHIHNVVGIKENYTDYNRRAKRRSRLRVSICHKKDKRGIVNYEEIVEQLQRRFPRADFFLESAVGKTPFEQVQMMQDADIYVCNEGTLATSFFLMRPGSAFISLPLVYHSPHLHQRAFSRPHVWWKEPDLLRPDPRKNTGGNIDWFPPAIPWVRTDWYDYIPLNETRIQLPLSSLRNYMPEFNIVLQLSRMAPLMNEALKYVSMDLSVPLSANPNYSINANLCRQILGRMPTLTTAFNSVKCFYGMSWLCEFWTNTHFRWRLFHEKWKLSHGHCGNASTTPKAFSLQDPREERPLNEFIFYTRERLMQMYNSTDLGPYFQPDENDVAFVL